ncbi:MAG: CRTAC1 family protein [Gammaproteobacteria bacterium]|nr:CRTAC1 family protein [Gammaproteobacteria bacterium]
MKILRAGKKIIPALCLGLLTVAATGDADEALFIDAGESSGLDFVHFNGMSGELYLPEIMGAGVAVFDFDRDGDLDIYLLQGHMIGPGKSMADAIMPPPANTSLIDRLYRNDTKVGAAALHFKDVTEKSGIRSGGYGMGVAAGDINNDGWPDLYISNLGHNQLWLNNGDGTFKDITEKAGVDDERWSVSAAFVDINLDGWLDLYVGNYVAYDMENPKPCRSATTARDYCGPQAFEPATDRLFLNRGDGSFADISEKSGITQVFGGALGVIAADFNGDHWPDIYVGNDGMANQLWINQQDGTFEDTAPLAGVSVNRYGMPEASMGVVAADFDGDGDEDLFMTHLVRETNTLYVNDGTGWFDDKTAEIGLGLASIPYSGFGTAWLDIDNDGWLDLLIVNGAVTLFESHEPTDKVFPLDRRNQLFANDHGKAFIDISDLAGDAFQFSEVSRGAATGDFDNDGDIDLVISNNSGRARLLLNQVGNKNAWLGVSVLDATGKYHVTGSKVALIRENRAPLWRRVRTDGSYASASDPRIVFGLGGSRGPQTIEVTWPGGERERWSALAANRYHELRRDSGIKTGQ